MPDGLERAVSTDRVAHIKRAVLSNKRKSESARSSDPYRFRVDRHYSDYITSQPMWERKVLRSFEKLKASGERVVYADICGRTTAIRLGAEISYCFALYSSRSTRLMHPEQDVIIDGDLFRMRDFYSFLALMRDRGDRPAFVTFSPMAGLQDYTPSPRDTSLRPSVTWQRLLNNLVRLLQVVRPGGYVYLERPFEFVDIDLADWSRRRPLTEYSSVKWMQNFCKDNHCSVEFDRDIFGTKFLIQKQK